MKYDNELGLYVAEDEDLETFCMKLIVRHTHLGRKVVGEYKDTFIYVGNKDTVRTLVKQYNEEQQKEKHNLMKKHPHNNLRRNASGYSDPTAYKAIMNLEREAQKQRTQREERKHDGK